MKQITLVRYVRFPDALFLERINDLADVLSVVVCVKLKGTEDTVRRRTDAGEKKRLHVSSPRRRSGRRLSRSYSTRS